METIIEFFTLTPEELARALVFIGIFAISVLFLSILITASSWKLFEKAGRSAKEAFIPVYNLVVLLQIAEIPSHYFFTLLVPFLNIVLLVYVAYRLAKLFKVEKTFMWGLIICPFIYIPLLSNSNEYKYKEPEEEVFISVSDEMPTVMSQEQIDALNKEEETKPKVDSVFKSEAKIVENIDSYKANKVTVNEEFVNSPIPPKEEIKRIVPVKTVDINIVKPPEEVSENKFIVNETNLEQKSNDVKTEDTNKTTPNKENEINNLTQFDTSSPEEAEEKIEIVEL